MDELDLLRMKTMKTRKFEFSIEIKNKEGLPSARIKDTLKIIFDESYSENDVSNIVNNSYIKWFDERILTCWREIKSNEEV